VKYQELLHLLVIAFTAVTVWLPGLNIVIPGVVLAKGLSMAAKQYSNMDEEDRKCIRSVARLARGGIDGIIDFLKK
jgi:hypothetical protein